MKVLSLLRQPGTQLISLSAMKRMAVSNVLIVGVQGLGAEIGIYFHQSSRTRGTYEHIPAKNVVLAGVKSVTLYDPEPVIIQDLGTQVSIPCLVLREVVPHILPSSSSDKKI